jgi:hypothetical protein
MEAGLLPIPNTLQYEIGSLAGFEGHKPLGRVNGAQISVFRESIN